MRIIYLEDGTNIIGDKPDLSIVICYANWKIIKIEDLGDDLISSEGIF